MTTPFRHADGSPLLPDESQPFRLAAPEPQAMLLIAALNSTNAYDLHGLPPNTVTLSDLVATRSGDVYDIRGAFLVYGPGAAGTVTTLSRDGIRTFRTHDQSDFGALLSGLSVEWDPTETP